MRYIYINICYSWYIFMKIIITESFDKKYLQKLTKYFSIGGFIDKLQQTQTVTPKYPYIKMKMRIRMIEFRWVTLIQQWKYLIPLLIHLKKDKQYWENIIWNTFEQTILDAQKQALKDIEDKKYRVY